MGKGARNRGQRSNAGEVAANPQLPEKLGPEEEQLLQELQRRVPGIQKLSPNQRVGLVRSFTTISSHSGPLPAPEDLKAYADMIPDGAERIMALTEKQSAHRMEIEKQVLRVAPKETARGQWFALFIGLAGLGTAAYIASLGMAGTAGTIATAALGTLAVGFLRNRKK